MQKIKTAPRAINQVLDYTVFIWMSGQSVDGDDSCLERRPQVLEVDRNTPNGFQKVEGNLHILRNIAQYLPFRDQLAFLTMSRQCRDAVVSINKVRKSINIREAQKGFYW